jgi:hypothetical protein
MPEDESAPRAALKTAERVEEVARREEAPAKAVREQPKRQVEGRLREDVPRSARRVEGMAAASYDDLAELNRAGMHATLKAGQAMLEATSSLAEELTRFACQRLRSDVETAHSLIESGSDWNKAIELQGKFAADAIRDYLEEMTKIAQLSAQTSRDVWIPLQELSTRLAPGEVARPS